MSIVPLHKQYPSIKAENVSLKHSRNTSDKDKRLLSLRGLATSVLAAMVRMTLSRCASCGETGNWAKSKRCNNKQSQSPPGTQTGAKSSHKMGCILGKIGDISTPKVR